MNNYRILLIIFLIFLIFSNSFSKTPDKLKKDDAYYIDIVFKDFANLKHYKINKDDYIFDIEQKGEEIIIKIQLDKNKMRKKGGGGQYKLTKDGMILEKILFK
ncbi:hypothetical protein [Treponema sp.]|uniref:hypothetical protein n=1 Tax=Treponema sp. TaxID=166 RepID=UPI00388E1348